MKEARLDEALTGVVEDCVNAVGVDLNTASYMLLSYIAGNMRQNITEKNGVTVIADCYNAAPESMRAALDVLDSLKVSGRKIAVLGDMRELGASSASLHFEVGKYAVEHGVEVLFTLGELGAEIAVGALAAGLNKDLLFVEKDIENIEHFAAKVKSVLNASDAILFKASRALRLERIIELIAE